MLDRGLLELRENFLSSDTICDINTRLHEFLRGQGFDSFVYGFAVTPDDVKENPSGVVMQTTLDSDLMDIYASEGGITNDPIAERAYDITAPEFFDLIPLVTDPAGRFSKHRLLELFLDCKMDAGALAPVKGSRGVGSFLAWTRGGTRQERIGLVNATVDGLIPAVAGLYHEAITRDRRLAGGFSLTPAELDTLHYIAHGYTASELADKLCRGERAIEKRLHRARTKLGAVNTPNAVYRAAILNLI